MCRVKAAVSHRRKWRHCVSLLAAFRPPVFRLPPCKSRCEFRRWLRLATVAGGRRTWTQPCFARLSRVPARTVSRDSWLEYIGSLLSQRSLRFLLNDDGQNFVSRCFFNIISMFRVSCLHVEFL